MIFTNDLLGCKYLKIIIACNIYFVIFHRLIVSLYIFNNVSHMIQMKYMKMKTSLPCLVQIKFIPDVISKCYNF